MFRLCNSGVAVQAFHDVLAVEVRCNDLGAVEDITVEYEARKVELQREYDGLPREMAERCTNYYVGEQMWFELFEKKRMR